MTFVGYHASHEQLPPSALLDAVVEAERIGFDGAFSADHLAPWTPQQGHSGNTIAWIGAALARTRFPIGSISTPGQRYHPVVTAHVTATLAEMFPGRYFAALGSGELLNEHVTGDEWPEKDERTARLGESVDVIRRLLHGETVDHRGRVTVHEARLWSLPETVPPLMATAVSHETARWAAGWADGIVTVGTDAEDVGAVVAAYRDAGGRGPACLQVHFALADTRREALELAKHQWAHAPVTPPEAWDVAQPEEFLARAGSLDDDEVQGHVIIGTNDGIDALADRLAALVGDTFDRVYLHEVSRDQAAFLRGPAPELLRALRERLATRGDAAAPTTGGTQA